MAWGLGQTMGRWWGGWGRSYPGLGRDGCLSGFMDAGGALFWKPQTFHLVLYPLLSNLNENNVLGSAQTPNLAQFGLENRRAQRL